MANTLQYPFGAADSQALSATGTQALTILNNMTIIDGKTTKATGNRTINLTIDSQVAKGAKISLQSKTNAAETTIFGTGFIAPTITGVAGKTFTQAFTYDGTNFLPDGRSVQID